MTGYMTQYKKSESKGESAYLIKFARTRARVRIKKTKFGEYPKERRKNNKNYCRTGKRVAIFSSDKIRALRFSINSRDFCRFFCRRGYYVRNFDSNRVEIRILDEI